MANRSKGRKAMEKRRSQTMQSWMNAHPESSLLDGLVMPEDLELRDTFLASTADKKERSMAGDYRTQDIKYIRELMLRGLWLSTQHIPVLSRKWGIGESAVRERASTAAKIIELLSGEDKLWAKNFLAEQLIETVGKAKEAGQFQAVAANARELTAIWGLAQNKMEITHDLASMPEDQLRREQAELIKGMAMQIGGEGVAKLLEEVKSEIPDAELVEEPTLSITETDSNCGIDSDRSVD